MTTINQEIAKGQLVPLLFTQDALAASQAAVAMNIIEATAVALTAAEYKMPFDGEVVAVSVLSDLARTADSATFQPTVNGTVKSPSVALDATNTTHHYVRNPRETTRFAAGDRIGCKATTGATWAPITADVAVIVWVLVYLEGI